MLGQMVDHLLDRLGDRVEPVVGITFDLPFKKARVELFTCPKRAVQPGQCSGEGSQSVLKQLTHA